MAKLMVVIEIPNYSYEELHREVIDKKAAGHDGWYSKEDGDRVVVDEAYLKRALCDDSFYSFELIGVRP